MNRRSFKSFFKLFTLSLAFSAIFSFNAFANEDVLSSYANSNTITDNTQTFSDSQNSLNTSNVTSTIGNNSVTTNADTSTSEADTTITGNTPEGSDISNIDNPIVNSDTIISAPNISKDDTAIISEHSDADKKDNSSPVIIEDTSVAGETIDDDETPLMSYSDDNEDSSNDISESTDLTDLDNSTNIEQSENITDEETPLFADKDIHTSTSPETADGIEILLYSFSIILSVAGMCYVTLKYKRVF